MPSSKYLDQPTPAPALNIPSSTATVAVRVIDKYSPVSKRFAEHRLSAGHTANSHSTVQRSFPSTLAFSGAPRSKVSKPFKLPSSAYLFPTLADISFSTWAFVTIGRTTLLAQSDSSKLPLPSKPRRTFPNTSTLTPLTSTSGAPTSQPSSGLTTTSTILEIHPPFPLPPRSSSAQASKPTTSPPILPTLPRPSSTPILPTVQSTSLISRLA